MAKTNIVKCKLCGIVTTNTGTSLCNECWELDWRIKKMPEIARKILQNILTK